jgi:hypothetical protein
LMTECLPSSNRLHQLQTYTHAYDYWQFAIALIELLTGERWVEWEGEEEKAGWKAVREAARHTETAAESEAYMKAVLEFATEYIKEEGEGGIYDQTLNAAERLKVGFLPSFQCRELMLVDYRRSKPVSLLNYSTFLKNCSTRTGGSDWSSCVIGAKATHGSPDSIGRILNRG